MQPIVTHAASQLPAEYESAFATRLHSSYHKKSSALANKLALPLTGLNETFFISPPTQSVFKKTVLVTIEKIKICHLD